jgi:hypothetical protein
MSRARSRKREPDEDVPPAITAHVLNQMATASLDARGNFQLATSDLIKALVARGYSQRASEDAVLMVEGFPGPGVCTHH